MENILNTIIAGLFTLAGIWLKYYLDERKNRSGGAQKRSPAAGSPRQPPARQSPPPAQSQPGAHARVEPASPGSWWALAAGILVASIAGALLARWVVTTLVDLLNLADALGELGWLPVAIAGLVWGLAFAFVGRMQADELLDMLFPVFAPYDDLFAPLDLGEFLGSLFTAFPLNVILTILLALGAASLGVRLLDADFGGLATWSFSILSALEILGFIVRESA